MPSANYMKIHSVTAYYGMEEKGLLTILLGFFDGFHSFKRYFKETENSFSAGLF